MDSWQDGWDRVEQDARERAESTSADGIRRAISEGYYAALEAAAGYAQLLADFQEMKLELNRLKSLESYKEQVERIEMLNVLNANLNTELKDYRSNPLNVRVADLESQLAIARKANHLEALQEAQKRIIELEDKLEERDG